MSANETSDLTGANMVALRAQPDALKVITGRLRVKEMGPADHIRTKHEVKAFVETGGNVSEAEAIIVRARARRELQQTQSIAEKMSERQNTVRRLKP